MIPVECLPSDIPPFVEVEVSELEINHHIHVSDLEMPAGVTIALAPEISLITVLAPRAETEEEKPPEEGEEVEGEAAEGEAPKEEGAEGDREKEKDKDKSKDRDKDKQATPAGKKD
jgi:large subunit ribosomal protein L25